MSDGIRKVAMSADMTAVFVAAACLTLFIVMSSTGKTHSLKAAKDNTKHSWNGSSVSESECILENKLVQSYCKGIMKQRLHLCNVFFLFFLAFTDSWIAHDSVNACHQAIIDWISVH